MLRDMARLTSLSPLNAFSVPLFLLASGKVFKIGRLS